ncbi:MAG: phenylacetate--CoA ligase family protein [Candidatus Moranbacteria bacterium]|nr:phenylacetate--CoA ligase family protein [Candidatus Moranbacteria bacterium]
MNIYYHLPVSIQNTIFSLYGKYKSFYRYSSEFNVYLNFLKNVEYKDSNFILNFQNEKFSELLEYIRYSDFYRKLYSEFGVDLSNVNCLDDIKKLPILDKDYLRNNIDLFIKNISYFSYSYNLTSGTSGTPIRIPFSREGVSHQWAIWWRHKKRFGLRNGDRHLMFGARIPISQKQTKPPFWRWDLANNRCYLSSYHLKNLNFPYIIELINSHKFKFFTGYPSAINQLCCYILDNNIKILNKPNVIVCGSDKLYPVYENNMKEAFGCLVTEQYGMTEFAGNFSKCEFGAWHLDYECCFAEYIPIENTDLHKLVLTGWGNPIAPMIRYDVGDVVKPDSDFKCLCGRSSEVVKSIEGRSEDYIKTSDGRMLMGFNQVLEYAVGVKEIQVIQKTITSLEFKIVPSNNFDFEKTRSALQYQTRLRAGDNMEVLILVVDSIPRAQSGKFKAVINEIGESA